MISTFIAWVCRAFLPLSKLFVVCLSLIWLTLPIHAGSMLDTAQLALKAGKYSNVIASVTNLLKSKSLTGGDTAQALLLRGMAHKAMGSNALAVADFSNAQWLGKLPKADTVSLLTQRASAYKALGNLALAERDLGNLSSLKKTIPHLATPVTTAKALTPVITAPKKQIAVPKIAQKSVSHTVVPRSKTINTAAQTTSTVRSAKRYVQAPSTNSNVIGTADLHGTVNQRPQTAHTGATQVQTTQPNGLSKLFSFFTGQKQKPVVVQPKVAKAPSLTTGTADPKRTKLGVSQWPAHKLKVVKANVDGLTPTKYTKKKVRSKPIVTGSLQPKTKRVVRKKTARKTALAPSQSDTKFLQLASFADKTKAEHYAKKISAGHKATVNKKSVMVVKTLIDNKDRFRIYLGPYPNHKTSMLTCAKLKQQGLDCIPVR